MDLVYWNLTRRCWSVKQANGKVYAHAGCLIVANARFVVREGGRQKVILTKQKNVHAFVRGQVVYMDDMNDHIMSGEYPSVRTMKVEKWRRVSYNPYYAGHFYFDEEGKPPATAASEVRMGSRLVEGVRRSLVVAF